MDWNDIIEGEEKRFGRNGDQVYQLSKILKSSVALRHKILERLQASLCIIFWMTVRMDMVNVAMHDWLAKPERFNVR